MGDFDLAAALGPDPGAPQPAPAHQEVKIGEHKADTPAPLPHRPAEPGGLGKHHKDGSCPHSSSSSSSSSSSTSDSEQDQDLGTHQKKKQKRKKDKKQKVAKEKKRH